MGLDAIEIILEVEDCFGITISDAEAEQVRTVGDLAAIVNARLLAASQLRCPSFESFLSIRQFMRDFLNRPQLRLKPSTEIAAIIPLGRRREMWRQLNAWLGETTPPLRRPRPIAISIAVISLLAFATGIATAWIDKSFVLIGFLSAEALAIILCLATIPCCVVPPANVATFGDLTRRLTGLTASTNPYIKPDEAFAALREIIVDALGVKPEQVVPTARFVQDLGMC
jgi:acyl carrier protein